MAGWVLRPLKSAARPSSDACVSSLKTHNCNDPCLFTAGVKIECGTPSHYDD